MAWKASQTQMVDNQKIMKFIIIALVLLHAYNGFIFFLNSHFEVSNFVRFCANMQGTDELWWLKILTFLLFLACNLTAIYFDIAMIRFIRQRSQVNPVPAQLVPWKSFSTNDSLSLKNKSGIPVRATILSTVSFAILSYFGLPTLSTSHYEREQVQWYRLLSMMLWLSLELPMLLIFTIRQRKGPNAVAMQPPKKLHFHEDPDPDPKFREENLIIMNKNSVKFCPQKD